MTSSSNNVVTAGRTYLDLITSTPAKPQNALPARPKTKRERADENWKILVSRHRPACARSLLAPCARNRTHWAVSAMARAKNALCACSAERALCACCVAERGHCCLHTGPAGAGSACPRHIALHARARVFGAAGLPGPRHEHCPHTIWVFAACCVAGWNYQGVRTIPQGIGTASEVPGAPARGSAKNF